MRVITYHLVHLVLCVREDLHESLIAGLHFLESEAIHDGGVLDPLLLLLALDFVLVLLANEATLLLEDYLLLLLELLEGLDLYLETLLAGLLLHEIAQ